MNFKLIDRSNSIKSPQPLLHSTGTESKKASQPIVTPSPTTVPAHPAIFPVHDRGFGDEKARQDSACNIL
jgi:hypothetical protein